MRPVPGPAGALVAPTARRTADDRARAPAETSRALENAAPSSNAAQRQPSVSRDNLDDVAFDSAPWTRATEALDVPSDAEPKHGVGWIRRGGWRSSRVPRGAFVVRELGATSSGDGAGTMCDPTGEIRVIVHGDLMASEPALRAGCAVVLREAPILSADGRSHAVCVTSECLVAVFEGESEVGTSAPHGKTAKERREDLRQRLLESAAQEALAGVVWEDESEDEGAAVAAVVERDDPAPSDRRQSETIENVPTGEVPSDFALQLAAMFADDDELG